MFRRPRARRPLPAGWAVIPATSTHELVASARAGDGRAFSLLAQRHSRAAFAGALAIVGNPTDAEDIAQEALLAAFEQLDSCREPARFSGWLLRIVKHRALNALSRRKVRDAHAERLLAEPADPEPERASPDMRARLLRALASLSPMQRRVVLLHELGEWTHAELAAELGVSEVTSRQHLFNARRKLRSFLADTALTPKAPCVSSPAAPNRLRQGSRR